MPPPISVQAVTIPYRGRHSFLIPSVARHVVSARHNSTSAIPPESPKYIDIPTPPQEQEVKKYFIKGVLPKPRQILPPQGPNKITEEYLKAVIPEPLTKNTSPSAQASDLSAWKARQAASRRENLRSSLKELAARKAREERYLAARSAAKAAETKALREAPEPDAERFTKATLLSSQTATGLDVMSEEYRSAYLRQKRRNYEARLKKVEEQRRDNLHTLYVNAGDFITTEKRMREEVDKAFDDTSQFDSEKAAGLNIWNLGVPESVQQRLASPSNDEQKAMLRDRMKRMAEALTGGKIKDQES